MRTVIACAIYAILEAQCGAPPEDRDAFVFWFSAPPISPHFAISGTLNSAVFQRASWCVGITLPSNQTPEHCAAVTRANEQIAALKTRICWMSPLERMEWVRQKEEARRQEALREKAWL